MAMRSLLVTGTDGFRRGREQGFCHRVVRCGHSRDGRRNEPRCGSARGETDVHGHIRTMGTRLREGLADAGRRQLGDRDPAQAALRKCPLMLFAADPEVQKGSGVLLGFPGHGAFFHPQNNPVPVRRNGRLT